MVTVSLSAERFEEFLRCLSLLKDECNDMDVRQGIARQRTNDNTVAFELDLSPIITNIDLPLVNIKQKIDLLKSFSGHEVEITVNETSYTFKDQYSSIRFDSPNLEFIDNKFISDEEINRIVVLNDEDLILSCDITKVISDRMKIITTGFNVNSVQVIFEGQTASICARTQSKDQYAKFISDIIAERDLNLSSYLRTTPFVIDHDGDIRFLMYNTQESTCMSKFSTSISDVNVTIYARSNLVSSEES